MLERRAIGRLAVRGQHELDRQVEQRTEPSDDIVARHVLATAELDVQSFAEVGERVAGDKRADRREPENEIVVLAARVRVDAERPRSGTVKVSFAFARAQPGRSSLSMPRTRSGSMPNFSTQSCQVSAGGVCTGRPSRRASRS